MSISEEHVRYVGAIARHYTGLGLDLDDLVQEGSLGLLAAARSFDASRGVPFTAYARWPIRQAICRALTANSRVATTACNEDELPPADTPDPLDRLCDDEARTLLRQALAGLDPRWRQVMVLRRTHRRPPAVTCPDRSRDGHHPRPRARDRDARDVPPGHRAAPGGPRDRLGGRDWWFTRCEPEWLSARCSQRQQRPVWSPR